MSAAEEQSLAGGLAAGDPTAIATFFERTHHPVYRMACRLTRDVEARRDWTHDVLLGVLDDVRQGRFTWRHPGSFWAWFARRAHFRLLDCYRNARRRATRETSWDRGDREGDDAGPEPASMLAGHDPTLTAQLELVEMAASVEACLQQLPNLLHQRALRLLLFDDLDYEAIAGAMEAPLNTVRAWIRRGRMQLRRCLARALGVEVGGAEVAP